jgi:hypothetical protein
MFAELFELCCFIFIINKRVSPFFQIFHFNLLKQYDAVLCQ